MNIDGIVSVLEQKKIIFTDIYNLSKKIELYINEDNADFLLLLDKREALLKRAVRCTPAIEGILNSPENEFTPEEQDRIMKIVTYSFDGEPSCEEEKKIIELVDEIKDMRDKGIQASKDIEIKVKKELKQTQNKLREENPAKKSQNIFR